MKKILHYYKAYIPALILLIAVLFGRALSELALPTYMAKIINDGIINNDMDYIKITGIWMLLIALAACAFSVISAYIASRLAAKTSKRIRRDLFHRVTDFSNNEMEKFGAASLITRETNDIQTIQQTSALVMRIAFYAPILGIGAIIKALQTSTKLSYTIGISLIAVCILMVFIFVMVTPKFKKIQAKLDQLNLVVGERLNGLLVIRAFNKEKYEEKRFDDTNEELRKINVFVNKAMSFMFPALMLIMNLTSVLIIYSGAKNIDAGNLMVGDMLAFLQYAVQVIMAFLFITMIFIMFPRAAVSANRIGAVLETESTITDKKDTKQLVSPKGKLEMKNVYFSYQHAKECVLEDINFTANPGEFTAIIGSTGSGKSTLLNLIPRFYDTSKGDVLIDGINIKDLSQKELRDTIGYVPQKALLFSGDIKSNLAYGKENPTDEEIQKALDISQSTEFVSTLPDTIHTTVSQGGTSVSGGQKQRLSIARALIKEPKILLFDDSFSALDFKTDQKLRQALKENVKDTTFIIVSQRINTIIDADKIIVMDHGVIVGTGTHADLMKDNAVYREIAFSQLSEDELSQYAGKEQTNG